MNELIPVFGVPEAILSDQGANLLSHLMMDICELLGIQKLNTTAYHPQCNGMVERFNCTLKGMLRAHAARFGNQWDLMLPGVLFTYRNTPHERTGEKPSFLAFGVDPRTPPEAAWIFSAPLFPTDLRDYREQLIGSLSSARELAATQIRAAQGQYKRYDQGTKETRLRVGDWVLIRFPAEETGARRKLSHPWHGPYRVTSIDNQNATAIKVYFPQEDALHVHLSRVCPVPCDFPAGYYWYGGSRRGPGRPPEWIDSISEDSKEPRYNLRSCPLATPHTARVEQSQGEE